MGADVHAFVSFLLFRDMIILFLFESCGRRFGADAGAHFCSERASDSIHLPGG